LAYIIKDGCKIERIIKILVKNNPENDSKTLYNLGKFYKTIKNNDESILFFYKAFKLGNNDSIYNIAALYEEKNDINGAIILYNEAIFFQKPKESYRKLAEIYLNQNKYDLSIEYNLKGIENNDCLCMKMLGFIYEDIVGNFELAEKYYLMAINNGDKSSYYDLANFYEINNNLELAEKYLLMAIEYEDYCINDQFGEVQPLFNLALFYQYTNKLDLAEKFYVILSDFYEDVDSMENLGKLYDKQEKNDLAEKYYLKVDRKKSVIKRLAKFYDKIGKFEKAEEYYLKNTWWNDHSSDEEDEDDEELINDEKDESIENLEVFYRKHNRLDLLEKFYLKEIIKYEDNSYIYVKLGEFYYENNNDIVLAEKYFMMAIDLNDEKAMSKYASLCEDLEKYDLAEKYYLLAIENGKTCVLYHLATLYEKLHRYKDAEKYYILADENGMNGLNELNNLYKKI
jgi:tetratricopeptide (TPR) repeat protein